MRRSILLGVGRPAFAIMSIQCIDLKWPRLPSSKVEPSRSKAPALEIPVDLDMSMVCQGPQAHVAFTLAPGSVATDVRQIAETTVRAAPRAQDARECFLHTISAQVEQLGVDRGAVDLQWRDDLVWKPFATLEVLSKARLLTKWMLKTPRNAYQEWPRLAELENVAQGSLRAHWHDRGVEQLPEREVSAWPSFLASYTGPSDANGVAVPHASALFRALTSAETDSVAVVGGMPLPRSLANAPGRRQAAILLAATKGRPLKLRCCPKAGHEASFAANFSMNFESDLAPAAHRAAARAESGVGGSGRPGFGGSSGGLGGPGGGLGRSSGFFAGSGSGAGSLRDPFAEFSRASRSREPATVDTWNRFAGSAVSEAAARS
jgi:hypothetical protein